MLKLILLSDLYRLSPTSHPVPPFPSPLPLLHLLPDAPADQINHEHVTFSQISQADKSVQAGYVKQRAIGIEVWAKDGVLTSLFRHLVLRFIVQCFITPPPSWLIHILPPVLSRLGCPALPPAPLLFCNYFSVFPKAKISIQLPLRLRLSLSPHLCCNLITKAAAAEVSDDVLEPRQTNPVLWLVDIILSNVARLNLSE